MSELRADEGQETLQPSSTPSEQISESEADSDMEMEATDEASATEPASGAEGEAAAGEAGKQLAVAAGDLLIVDLETGQAETLVSVDEEDLSFQEVYWSPRGDWIATEAEIVQDGPLVSTGLFLIRPDGSELTQVGADDLEKIGKVSWAPAGDRFAVEADASEAGRGTYLVNPETAEYQRLATDLSAAEPAWSPDGTQLAISAGGFQLHTLSIEDPDSIQQLTEDAGAAHEPEWSPEGDSLVFEYEPEEASGSADIRLIGADGEGLVDLTENDLDERNPSWSPAGDRIAFMRELADAPFEWELVLIDPDGSNELALSAELLSEDQRPGGQTVPVPEWSANGQQLALIGGNRGIHLLAADGSAVETLEVQMAIREPTLSWAPFQP